MTIEATLHPAAGLAPVGFAGLALARSLNAAVDAAGYRTPTPIQETAIPHVLAGRDLLGCAQTGTGKTAAFALPILHRLLETPADARRRPRALVLAPTRELAAQIGESFRVYGEPSGIRRLVVFGGVGKPAQIRDLRRGVDVLVATPGRLLDLMGDGHVALDQVRFLVLDEADRMLDMGFIHDVRRIERALPRKRQTLLFSATMPREIEALARRILVDPVRVAVDPVSSTVAPIAQSVYFVDAGRKGELLIELLRERDVERALVFTRTKRGANRVAEHLGRASVAAAAIHGNKSQSARERALADFKSGRTRVVVATDIAARGIDVKGLSHVINYDLPAEPESYVHRVGRTGRAGATGIAFSLCAPEERAQLASIERLTRQRLERRETPERLRSAPHHGAPAEGPRSGRRPLAGGRGKPAGRRPGGDRPEQAGRGSGSGDRPERGGRMAEGNRPQRGGRMSESNRPQRGGRMSESNRPERGGRMAEGNRPERGGRMSEGNRPQRGGRRPGGDRAGRPTRRSRSRTGGGARRGR